MSMCPISGGGSVPVDGGAAGPGPSQVDAASEVSAAGSDPRLADLERALTRVPMQTTAPSGLPGDPVNVCFVGSQAALQQSFEKAGWARSDQSAGGFLHYAVDFLERKIDNDAPVSALNLFGRAQDLAFEQAESADARHHVRFWNTGLTLNGEPVWVGSASHDAGTGEKKNFAQALETGIEGGHVSPWLLLPTTHVIDPKVDAERDKVAGDLARGGAQPLGSIPGYRAHTGTNGDGYAFSTDGNMSVIVAPRS